MLKGLRNMRIIDWHLLAGELIRTRNFSRQELAGRCGVSHQSVSNWINRTVKLKPATKRKLLKIAGEEGVDIAKFRTSPAEYEIPKHLEKSSAKDLARIFEFYMKISPASRVELLRYVNTLLEAEKPSSGKAATNFVTTEYPQSLINYGRTGTEDTEIDKP